MQWCLTVYMHHSIQLVRLHIFFFFFSSRRRHTRLQGDWSSDVCSSDLVKSAPQALRFVPHRHSGSCPTGTPQRTSNREPGTETYRVTKCSHPDTARCSKCLTSTVVSRPVSPASPESESEENF